MIGMTTTSLFPWTTSVGWWYLAQHRETIRRGDDAPFANGSQFGDGRLLGHRRITVGDAELKPFDIGAPGRLALLARCKERLHEQTDFVVQLIDRELVKDHSFPAPRPGAEQDDPPDHVRVFEAELLRDHAAERKAHDVKPRQVERAAELDTVLGQCRDGRRRLAGGAADAGIIDEDQVAFWREAVRHLGIPVVQVRCEIVQQQQGMPPRRPKRR